MNRFSAVLTSIVFLHSFCRRVEELETLVDRVEEKAKTQVETMTARLHEKSAEVTTLKLEIERLKVRFEIES